MQPFGQNLPCQNDTHQHDSQTYFNSLLSTIMGKKVGIDFNGGNLTSDAGVLLLGEIARYSKIIEKIAMCISDTRRKYSIRHSIANLLTQRVLQICCGYPDANDANAMRTDPALKMAVNRLPDEGENLASQPTLSRIENTITAKELIKIARAFIDHFIQSFPKPPAVIVLDFDDTADQVHGKQQLSLFNAYHNGYCFLPIHVYDGITGKLITTILRPGRRPCGKEISAYLKRIVGQLRKHWPNTKIYFRGDGHYSAPEVFDFIAAQDNMVSITGLNTNSRLKEIVKPIMEQVVDKNPGTKRYHSFLYKADSWKEHRRVIAKIEITETGGLNVRFISTDIQNQGAKFLYEIIYCDRGNAELYIKDHKTYTTSDRTSCHKFTANQFRLFLHSAAYVLLHTMRSEYLGETELANATFDTIRLKLLKVGARVVELKTKIRVHLASSYPFQTAFINVLNACNQLHRPIVSITARC